jgi:hypothetical protein
MADTEMIQEKIGEATALEGAAQKAVETLTRGTAETRADKETVQDERSKQVNKSKIWKKLFKI